MKTIHPTSELEIPSTQKKIHVRPITGKDEKLLLMAKQSGEIKEILSSIKQVVDNCIIDEKFDVNSLTIFDLEWMFLQLWGISADNIIKVSYNDNEDNKEYDFEINITDIKVDFPENISSKIVIDSDQYIKMKWPSVIFYTDVSMLGKPNIEIEDEMIFRHVDSLVTKKNGQETVQPFLTKEDTVNFIDGLPLKIKKQVRDFMDSDPSMIYKISYTNSKGTERVINLSSLADFFIFV
jgi:hypothetical protein